MPFICVLAHFSRLDVQITTQTKKTRHTRNSQKIFHFSAVFANFSPNDEKQRPQATDIQALAVFGMCPPRGYFRFALIFRHLHPFAPKRARVRDSKVQNAENYGTFVSSFSPNSRQEDCMAFSAVCFISREISLYLLNACEFSLCPDIDATRRLSPVAA